MIASENCLALIRHSEGFSTTPYRCPAGVPTIGYGSTRYVDGRAVKLSDPSITQVQADEIMLMTLKHYEAAVTRYVQVDINQNQFDALVDFAYNVGAKALLTSTLLRRLNAGETKLAAAQFGRWVHGGGEVLLGLVKRRAAEHELFERA